MKSLTLVFFLSAILGRAQLYVPITFSGGNGTPLTITIHQDVVYTRTLLGSDADVALVFRGVGFSSGTYTLTGPAAFAVNASPQSYDHVGSGFVANDMAVGDFYFFGNPIGVSMSQGDTFQLSAGSYTTAAAYLSIAPADGSFYSFIANTSGTNIAAGSAIPEPGNIGLAAGLMGILCVGLVKRWRESKSHTAA